MPQAAASPRAASFANGQNFARWDCINTRQREKAKEPRFSPSASLLTSPATCRPPPKCGAFRLQPLSSPLRQTACWREVDSNHRFLVRRSRFLLRKANCGGSNGGGLLKVVSLRATDGFESISLQRRVLCEPTSRAKKGGLETMASQRGTDGSNPGPSSGESAANLRDGPPLPAIGAGEVSAAGTTTRKG